MEAVTGLQPKTLIRLMHAGLERKKRSRERGSIYNPEFQDAIRVIAEALGYPCAKRLQLLWLVPDRRVADAILDSRV